MQFKRNYSANLNSNQGKSSPLIQPILNIAKASTPVRTRIVKPGSQLNSTPVNLHKIAKSPTISNKQNDNQNQLQFRKPKITQKNINLSPILALNRKLTEGPNVDVRSLTPNGFKRQQSLADILRQSRNNPIHQYQTTGMQSSKTFSQTLQQATLNTFKTLKQSRQLTPSQQNSNKKLNQSGFLRSSGSTQSLLNGMKKLKDSKCQKLSQSRSFDQLLSLGNSKVRQDDVLCINEHKQKLLAKYKVVKMNNDDEEDEDLLVYCSKCAIGLVNQNFKVQELTKQQKNYLKSKRNSKPYQHPNPKYTRYISSMKHSLTEKLSSVQYQKNQGCNQYNKDLQEIDSYYNSIISLVEEQRVQDRQKIIKTRDHNKQKIQKLQKRINAALAYIDDLIEGDSFTNQQLLQVQNLQPLLSQFCAFPPKAIQIFDNIQEKFDYFAQLLDNTFKLSIDKEKTEINTSIANDSALRFSFEKMLKMKQKNQFTKYKSDMNTLEQADECMEAEQSVDYIEDDYEQKKAFRTLFPEQQQSKPDLYSPTFKQF